MVRHFANVPRLAVLAALALATLGSTQASAQSWHIDPNHSQVSFSVKHFFTPVNGTFDVFEASLDYDAENPAQSSVTVTIPVESINTGNDSRDGHLRTGDFFEAEAHPNITFKSTSVQSRRRSAGRDRPSDHPRRSS